MDIYERALMFHTSKSLLENGYVDVDHFMSDMLEALNAYYPAGMFESFDEVSERGCIKILSLLSKQKLVELGYVNLEEVYRDHQREQSALEEDLADTRRHEANDDFSRTPEREPLV